jgi:NADH:ubiquinone oxidoreductase subunit 6 (subunit J)
MDGSVTVDDRIQQEARVRPRYSVIAGVSGILLLASAVVATAGPQPKVSEITVQLLAFNSRAGAEVAGAVLNAVGLFGVAVTLGFLLSATRARKPEVSDAWRYGALAGGVIAAAGGIAYGILIVTKAHQFATTGQQTYQEANNLLKSGAVVASQYGGLIGVLLLAIGLVLISLNAMRVGLLTRFMGYLGMASAAATILLAGSPPALLLEVYWLLALAYLLWGRWPTGVPPAWQSGQATPWPSGAQLRAQRARARGGTGRPSKPQAKPEPEPEAVGAASTRQTRSTTPKRKRKRRR